MTTGKNHALITKWLTVPVGLIGAGISSLDPLAITFSVVGNLIGLYIHPDLDIKYTRTNPASLVHSHRKMINNFGWGGWMWVLLWWPYGKLLPHRSPYSHYPLLGTVIRLIYLFPLTLLLWWYGGIYFWYFVGGLMISDIGHWVADGCPS